MKTLYVSDLDGTLLNTSAELSDYTITTLNELIGKGMNFTIATARSAASVEYILKPINLSIPVILMNGVLIYDLSLKKYIKIHYLTDSSLEFILNVLKSQDIKGFMYEVKEDMLTTYYEELRGKALKEFYEERVTKYQKNFIQVTDFSKVNKDYIIYFTLLDTKKHLDFVYQQLKENEDIAIAYYEDIYSTDKLWYMEIFSKNATKYNAIQYLRAQYSFDTITGFGDNLNDIPLFLACDSTYAVDNAKEEVKAAADHIIESNLMDGVAKCLRRNFI